MNMISGSMRFCALLLALALSAPAAASSWYQIELILFLNRNPDASATQLTGQDPGQPNIGDAIPLQTPKQRDFAYALLPPGERNLNAHRLQLDRSGRYDTLLHLAWRQPVTNDRTARTLYFSIPEPQPGSILGAGDADTRLTGTIRMSRGRYLHADLDLLYREFPRVDMARQPGENPQQSVLPRAYRLKEKRRMRRDELHYLDHPTLGALIVANRFRVPGAEEEATESDDPAKERDNPAPMAPN